MTDKTIAAILSSKRAALEKLSSSSQSSRAAVDLDQTKVGRLSRMDALQQQAMENAIEQRRRRDIARIEAALQRLETGDYGYCTTCGESIAAERLAVDPAATLCLNCAA